MKLLTTANYKLLKGTRRGYITYGLHLSPHKLSGSNVCPHASPGCSAACLNTAGRGTFTTVQEARLRRTRLFLDDIHEFMDQIAGEIAASIRSAARRSMTPCFRLNLTSDVPWENVQNRNGLTLMRQFPTAIFYDYTKNPGRMARWLEGKMPGNYHLTFSKSETNDAAVNTVLEAGGSVAAVFANGAPGTWRGRVTVDGDRDDLRFLDPRNVIVALRAKGQARKDTSGFVIHA